MSSISLLNIASRSCTDESRIEFQGIRSWIRHDETAARVFFGAHMRRHSRDHNALHVVVDIRNCAVTDRNEYRCAGRKIYDEYMQSSCEVSKHLPVAQAREARALRERLLVERACTANARACVRRRGDVDNVRRMSNHDGRTDPERARMRAIGTDSQ